MDNKKNNIAKWGLALVIIALVGLFAITTPNKTEHQESITTEVKSAVSEALVGKLGQWAQNEKVAAMGNIVTNKVAEMLVESNLDVKNYFLFSLGSTTINGESHTISIGALKHVWVFFDKEDLKPLIEEKGTQMINDLIGNLPSVLGSMLGIDLGQTSTDKESTDNDAEDGASYEEVPEIEMLDSFETVYDSLGMLIDDVTKDFKDAVDEDLVKAIEDLLSK